MLMRLANVAPLTMIKFDMHSLKIEQHQCFHSLKERQSTTVAIFVAVFNVYISVYGRAAILG